MYHQSKNIYFANLVANSYLISHLFSLCLVFRFTRSSFKDFTRVRSGFAVRLRAIAVVICPHKLWKLTNENSRQSWCNLKSLIVAYVLELYPWLSFFHESTINKRLLHNEIKWNNLFSVFIICLTLICKFSQARWLEYIQHIQNFSEKKGTFFHKQVLLMVSINVWGYVCFNGIVFGFSHQDLIFVIYF